MEVNCGEAKFIYEDNKIMHVFNSEIVATLEAEECPDLVTWINDRQLKTYTRDVGAEMRKWLTFKVCAEILGLTAEELTLKLLQKELATTKRMHNAAIVVIPTEKALELKIALRGKSENQYMWNRIVMKDIV